MQSWRFQPRRPKCGWRAGRQRAVRRRWNHSPCPAESRYERADGAAVPSGRRSEARHGRSRRSCCSRCGSSGRRSWPVASMVRGGPSRSGETPASMVRVRAIAVPTESKPGIEVGRGGRVMRRTGAGVASGLGLEFWPACSTALSLIRGFRSPGGVSDALDASEIAIRSSSARRTTASSASRTIGGLRSSSCWARSGSGVAVVGHLGGRRSSPRW